MASASASAVDGTPLSRNASAGAASGGAPPNNDQMKPTPSSSSSKPTQPGDPSDSPHEDFVAKGLKFLSTATPETLGGIGIGLAAATYVVLGKLGLILIGAFGGVILFISYESRHPEVSRVIRSERGTDVLTRLGLDKTKDAQEANTQEEEQRLVKNFDDFGPETREALVGVVDAVIRDYVKWWYSPILPSDSSFPLACRKTLNSFILSVSNTLARKRPADTFLDFLTNSSSIVIVFLSELSAAYAEVPAETNITATEAVRNYLEENPDSSLASLLNRPQQAAKFRMVAEDILQFLDRSSHQCDPARVFLREIMAGVVLEMSLQACSKPEWINGWIVYLLEAGEPDFSQAIDVGMQRGSEATNASATTTTNNNNNNAFADIDGNVGNINLSKGNRNSFDQEKLRRKDVPLTHKKKLSKADEEMETAMEEMKRMNAMIAEAESRKSREAPARDSEAGKASREMQRSSNEESTRNTSTMSGEESPRSQSSAGKPTADESVKGDSLHSPITPRSTIDMSSQNSSPKHAANGGTAYFTSFDQIVAPTKDEPEAPDEGPRKPPLTLYNATITLLDDSTNEGVRIKNKPQWDYMVQIEPKSSHYAGWMTVRRYSDFETLHEILRRIANISGATAFTEQHATLPNWKLHTRESLRGELERYIRDACWYQTLAESEGMKRFLDRDLGNGRDESKGLAWDSVGKNMVDVLSLGSKGAMEGGKAMFDGVTGVFNTIGLGPRRQTAQSLSDIKTQDSSRLSINTPPRMDSMPSMNGAGTSISPAISPGGPRKPRDSLDSQRSSVVSVQPGKMAPMERRPSYDSRGEAEGDNGLKPRADRWDRPSPSAMGSREHSRASSLAALRSPLRSPSTLSLDGLKFTATAEETYGFHESPTTIDAPANGNRVPESGHLTRENSSTNVSSPLVQTHTHTQSQSQGSIQSQGQTHAKKGSNASIVNGTSASTSKPAPRQFSKLTEQETRVAVELVFAIINEMYTLSSAWNIRRTLLAAAKSFLLRPGNPSLVSIQRMMQQSVIEDNTSDAGLAHMLRRLRENTMPSDEERAAWPEEMTDEEKEKLRVKARKMLIERGVPEALTGVMGQAATTDALGRIFDCLQIDEVARGLMFGVILQCVRVITH